MKKIMFNDRYGLTAAVLLSRKTMTRRIIPPIEIEWARRGRVTLPVSGYEHGCLWIDCRQFLPDSGKFDYVAPQKYQPAYSKGEEVAVAMSYKDVVRMAYEDESVWQFLVEKGLMQSGGAINTEFCQHPVWTNKMFVRADLMPYCISITDIMLQRLNNISDEDCLREGVEKWLDCYIVPGIMENGGKNNKTFDTPRQAFAALIDKVSGKGTWNSNPWTYAYTFELTKQTHKQHEERRF